MVRDAPRSVGSGSQLRYRRRWAVDQNLNRGASIACQSSCLFLQRSAESCSN